MEFTVELYESPEGERVVENKLLAVKSQSLALYAQLLSGLNRLKDRQNHKEPLCKAIGDGLFELRVGGKDIARVILVLSAGTAHRGRSLLRQENSQTAAKGARHRPPQNERVSEQKKLRKR